MTSLTELTASIERLLQLTASSAETQAAARTVKEQVATLSQALAAAQSELHLVTGLYIISSRLSDDLQADRIVEAICELIVNVVGSEDFTVYIVSSGTLVPARGYGPSFAAATPGPLDDERFAQALASDAPVYGAAGELAHFVLRRRDGAPLALVAVRSLLSHCHGLSTQGMELVAALQRHAGNALELRLAGERAGKDVGAPAR